MSQGYQSLTEKEKETLRLLVRGYDAKSIARHFKLSVHTVNERLRNARQKMEVSSSREAARVLHDTEAGTPYFLGNKLLGEAGTDKLEIGNSLPGEGRRPSSLRALLIGGTLTMLLIIAAFALAPTAHINFQTAGTNTATKTNTASTKAESDVAQAARQWLALVDGYKWQESWNATGQSFKNLNTADKWASVAGEVQPKMGAVLSRTLQSQEFVPAPPSGYEMVKFQTNFASKSGAVEVLTLVREDSQWKVVGYWIE